MRLGPSPGQQLCGPRGSLPAPECSVPLWISTRSSVHGGVVEAKAPNYSQPLLKIFCAVSENSEVQSLCMLMGRGFMSWIKWERATWCWRLPVGRGGRFGVPWAAPCTQHQHSTQIAPTPSCCHRNGCKTGTLGCLLLSFSGRPGFWEKIEETTSVSSQRDVFRAAHFTNINKCFLAATKTHRRSSVCSRACNKAEKLGYKVHDVNQGRQLQGRSNCMIYRVNYWLH